ncbi:hypothetical protein [Streptomyces violens]|uniref:hypothetical protein n=1 Tax=Streptomyces violens TaxID=66377 RepID=UPI0004C04857|nr:hypothetical protein [Streptomyces violens]
MADDFAHAANELLADYRAGTWRPDAQEQTAVEHLAVGPLELLRVRRALLMTGMSGRLADVLAAADALLDTPQLAAGDAGAAALKELTELLAALAADEAGAGVEPTVRAIEVAGTVWFFMTSGSRLPLVCRTCGARTGGVLTARHEDATYECAEGHLTRDPRLTAAELRQAIRTTAPRLARIDGDFYISVDLR